MPNRENANEIEDAATQWAARAERGLRPEERADLDRWLEGDSRHLGAFVRAQAAWIHAERAAALGKMPDTEPPAALPPEQQEEDEPQRRRAISRRMILGGGGVVAASIAAAAFFGLERTYALESGVGEIRRITLKGGTSLVLDTDTRVDVGTASDDRKLELKRGKLFLDVVRKDGLPLLVRTGDLALETAQAAFALQSLLDAPVVALVTTGQLAVSQSHGLFGERRALTLGRDQSLMLSAGADLVASNVRSIGPAQRDQLLAWRDGMLAFGGEPLAQAVRAFDRYGSIRILVDDPELGRERITGLFKATDPRGFATAMAASFGGSVASHGDVVRIYAKKLSAS
jgi:transmembrane sensor